MFMNSVGLVTWLCPSIFILHCRKQLEHTPVARCFSDVVITSIFDS
jgi:hypothetical protein